MLEPVTDQRGQLLLARKHLEAKAGISPTKNRFRAVEGCVERQGDVLAQRASARLTLRGWSPMGPLLR